MKTSFYLLLLSIIVIISTASKTVGNINSVDNSYVLQSDTLKKNPLPSQISEQLKENQQYWDKWYEFNSDYLATELYTKKQPKIGCFLLLK